MDFQSDRTLRLTQGQVDVDTYPTEARSAEVGEYIRVGNNAEAERATSWHVALLSCRGSLPSWWDDHENRHRPAMALGLDDCEIGHYMAKRALLPLAHTFICQMRAHAQSVLVYCCHGSSRSVVVAAYHVAIKERITGAKALDKVMQSVPWAAPSLGMIGLLMESLHLARQSNVK